MTMINNSYVSVLMPVFNAQEYLAESIQSILNQNYKDFELIIVNDGSTDKSGSIINSFKDKRIKVIEQENQGLSQALINGFQIAQGDFIARIDADDIAHHDRLTKQVEFLQNNPDFILVGGNAEIIDIEGNYLYTTDMLQDWGEIKQRLPHNSFIHSTVVFKRNAYIASGGYPADVTRMTGFEDVILWNRMAGYGKMCNLSDVVSKYRLWPFSGSFHSKKVSKIRVSILNKYFDNNYITTEDIESFNNLKKKKNRNKLMGRYYALLMRRKILHGNKVNMFQYFKKSTSNNPTSCLPYIYLIASIIPDFAMQRIIKVFR